MTDTKTVTSKFTLGVACPETSTKDSRGRMTAVVLKHIPAGEPVTLPAADADVLIARGQAVEVTVEQALVPKPKTAA